MNIVIIFNWNYASGRNFILCCGTSWVNELLDRIGSVVKQEAQQSGETSAVAMHFVVVRLLSISLIH